MKGLNGIKNDHFQYFVDESHFSSAHGEYVDVWEPSEPTEQIHLCMYLEIDLMHVRYLYLWLSYIVISTVWDSTSVISKRLQLQLQMNKESDQTSERASERSISTFLKLIINNFLDVWWSCRPYQRRACIAHTHICRFSYCICTWSFSLAFGCVVFVSILFLVYRLPFDM